MSMNRRELLGLSALLLAAPHRPLHAAGLAPPAQAQPLRLCWNENPYGPSPRARLAVSHAIAAGCRYPSDEEMHGLAQALARKEGVDSAHIVSGTGSGELLCALGLLAARDGGEIVAAAPTYADLNGDARCRAVDRGQWGRDRDRRARLCGTHRVRSRPRCAAQSCAGGWRAASRSAG